MIRLITCFICCLAAISATHAQTMMLSISSDDYQISNVFSDIDTFAIDIEINTPLASGNFVNPDIINVTYSVSGTLVPGTPSGFPSFALQRDITGTEFYAQGSSLSFEIAANAVLSDGIQIAELVGGGIVFTFNGREVDNGRFHPALLELDIAGTGRIQNSDNVVVENPLQQVDFGEEYITDLLFDPGNTTLITGTVPTASPRNGGGASSIFDIGVLAALFFLVGGYRRSGFQPRIK